MQKLLGCNYLTLRTFAKKNIKPKAVFEDGRKSIMLAEAAQKSVKSKKFEQLKIN